jgi:hypothetical protein
MSIEVVKVRPGQGLGSNTLGSNTLGSNTASGTSVGSNP